MQAGIATLLSGGAATLLGQPPERAVLVGWCCGVLLWLVAVLNTMLRLSPEAMDARADALDDGKWAILAASLAGGFASLVAVVWDLAAAPKPVPGANVLLALAAITLSWAFVHVLFALHYAHEHWRANEGLVFPGNDAPDFFEFLYFAFTVGMTFQVSDATTATAAMRRLVLLHGLTSFLFNAVILAAAVNVAASLAGN